MMPRRLILTTKTFVGLLFSKVSAIQGRPLKPHFCHRPNRAGRLNVVSKNVWADHAALNNPGEVNRAAKC